MDKRRQMITYSGYIALNLFVREMANMKRIRDHKQTPNGYSTNATSKNIPAIGKYLNKPNRQGATN